jgi:hypothetical protein
MPTGVLNPPLIFLSKHVRVDINGLVESIFLQLNILMNEDALKDVTVLFG